MPFQTACPGCRTVFTIATGYEGKQLRCKSCEQVFTATPLSNPVSVRPPWLYDQGLQTQPTPRRRDPEKVPPKPPPLPVAQSVPAASSAPSVKRQVAERERPPRKAPSSRAKVWIITGAAAGALLLIVGGGLALLLPTKKGEPAVEALVPQNNSQVENSPASPAAREPRTHGVSKGQLSAETLKDLKAATVFIKVEAGRVLSCSGSGFLVKVDGDTGYLVTNHHVINPEAEMLTTAGSSRGGRSGGVRIVKYKATNAAVTAVFHSGSKAERGLRAEVLATDESRDLAVLRVRGLTEWPRPITLEEHADLVETMPVYILGFPFGESLSLNKGNPAITINKGSVSSLREDQYGEMKAVQIDGAINPGNSGGPVVDEQGHLVGISVATIRGAGIGLAIAPDELARLFEGRVGAVGLTRRNLDADAAEFGVEMQLIDPQGQIKSAAVLYLVKSGPQTPLQPNANGTFNPLAGAQRLDLTIGGQKATGVLQLAISGIDTPFLVYQTVYVNGAGVTKHTQAISKTLAQAPVAAPPNAPSAGRLAPGTGSTPTPASRPP